jgi:uncharacterized protein with HEPN domain
VPFRDPQRHLADVLDAIEKIEGFIGDIDLTAYRTDEKTKSAVERKIQILTEAIIRLEDESPGEYPEIDQKAYRGMGNILSAFLPSCRRQHSLEYGERRPARA